MPVVPCRVMVPNTSNTAVICGRHDVDDGGLFGHAILRVVGDFHCTVGVVQYIVVVGVQVGERQVVTAVNGLGAKEVVGCSIPNTSSPRTKSVMTSFAS